MLHADQYKYKLPSTLQESKLVVADADKPAALCILLQQLKDSRTVVFVSSVDATAVLFNLIRIFESRTGSIAKAVEYSAATQASMREAALEKFKSGCARILICSDALTRGIDIPDIETVINYDAPVYPKTYVHRAGRTARAGRSGRVITILRKEDVRHFRAMLRKADNNYVRDERIDPKSLSIVRDQVDEALDLLEQRQPAVVEDNSVKFFESNKLLRKRRRLNNLPEICIL